MFNGNMHYTEAELMSMGFRSLGKNVYIDRTTPIYFPEKISLGDNVKIGSFCILSGEINIGNCVYVASYSFLSGKAGIDIEDYVSIGHGVKILTGSDDYSGEYLSAAIGVPEKYKNITYTKIVLEKHVIVGAGSILLPNSYLSIGTAVGAMSMIKFRTEPFYIYAGVPAKKIKERSRKFLDFERKLLDNF
ncbi:acyltransferase [Helicobacter pullorum]|uniref:acyltransferase n=1 Tax=Helicobacter pullorum TaxID=35818 RepID=UPI00211B8730|nr:acyltransferase [Helicobacter pullorum]